MNSYDEEKISKLSDSALRLLEGLSSITGKGSDKKSVAVQFQDSGVGLWNKAVALKSAGAISSHLNAQSRLCSVDDDFHVQYKQEVVFLCMYVCHNV